MLPGRVCVVVTQAQVANSQSCLFIQLFNIPDKISEPFSLMQNSENPQNEPASAQVNNLLTDAGGSNGFYCWSQNRSLRIMVYGRMEKKRDPCWVNGKRERLHRECVCVCVCERDGLVVAGFLSWLCLAMSLRTSFSWNSLSGLVLDFMITVYVCSLLLYIFENAEILQASNLLCKYWDI